MSPLMSIAHRGLPAILAGAATVPWAYRPVKEKCM